MILADPWATVMTEVTQILSRIDSGDPTAAEQLLPLVYAELRRLATECAGGESGPCPILSAFDR